MKLEIQFKLKVKIQPNTLVDLFSLIIQAYLGL
ncbi:hypothetical protein BF38_6111 (plasmid) [Bacillus thuringiensis]|uniref:Transposase n=1 Tax=Bacillus thuringiensis TaxID=1428 RepID=A0AB33APM6_BACTU|nr:hypothetical protein BF38_6111 [Bacillus thuringiensis]